VFLRAKQRAANGGALVVAGVRQGSGKAMSGADIRRTAVFARDLTDPDL
jgi:hypothetical protein